MQLFDLQQERLSPSHRAKISFHTHIQGSESLSTYTFNTGQAFVLQNMWVNPSIFLDLIPTVTVLMCAAWSRLRLEKLP